MPGRNRGGSSCTRLTTWQCGSDDGDRREFVKLQISVDSKVYEVVGTQVHGPGCGLSWFPSLVKYEMT